MSVLAERQRALARYLRNPGSIPAPAGVEPRRLKIYRDLVYNNIEGFISGAFPVLSSLYTAQDWAQLITAFIAEHRCKSPYFLEIPQEFLQYLMEQHTRRDCDPPFLTELAHYEWVELALDTSEAQPPPAASTSDPLSARPVLSPLAWVLSYDFPVHRIGVGCRPARSESPTYLVVYRNRDDQVKFMELNATTARLLTMISENRATSGEELLRQLAVELGQDHNSDRNAVLDFGAQQLNQFWNSGIIGLE